MLTLAKQIVDGRRLSKQDDLTMFLNADLKELQAGAHFIRKQLCGSNVDLCSIINGRSGRCSENCKFCAQSVYNQTNCETYEFMEEASLLEGCTHAYQQGVNRFSIVTAGRTVEGADLEKALSAYQKMHETYPDMILCASHGLMKPDDLKKLVNVGVTMYHANVETSRNYFSQICTTHSYEDKQREIQQAKDAGLCVCCGGILGMGESWQDRLDMACEIAQLEITSIPLNFLIPIAGTALASTKRLETDEIIRIVSIFRYINPTAFIRIAAGRNYFPDGGKVLFESGANAMLTGDMLTTVGNNTAQDKAMIKELEG